MESNNNALTKDQLEKYYKFLYPADLLCKWFGYLKDQTTSNVLLSRREFSMTLQIGDQQIYKRFLSFKSAKDFQQALIKDVPIKMDIGAVYEQTPKKGNVNTPQQKQFVLDLDIDSYDNVRTCCKGPDLCQICWKLMRVAAKILYRAMQDDFGFKDMLFVFSGRRGMHLWVCDERARNLSDSMRRSLMEYMYLVTGNEQSSSQLADQVSIEQDFSFSDEKFNNRKDFKNHYRTHETHPFVASSLAIIQKYFKPFLEESEIFLDRVKLATLQKIIEARSKVLLENIRKRWERCQDSISIFQAIISQLEIYERYPQPYKQGQPPLLNSNDCYQYVSFIQEEILLTFMYPRLDINVSTSKNHLLKCPFSVHPKTKKISIPFDYESVDKFDPKKCVLLPDLLRQANQLLLQDSTRFSSPQDLSLATSGLGESLTVLNKFVKRTLLNLKKQHSARNLQM